MLLIQLFCAFTTTGAAFLKITNAPMGDLQTLLDPKRNSWFDTIAIVILKMSFDAVF